MVERIRLAPQGPEFSRMICGYWRLMEWGMSPQQLLTFIEQHVELGVTTADHADIYGGYACEQAFGDALRLKPALRQSLELVTKCGIATTAKPGNPIGHYITDRDHIVQSAEQSLRHLHTDYLDLLLIHRPDPLMDADDVAEAFVALHKSGKVRHFGVSNFTPAQFQLLQSRLPFTLATNQWRSRRFTSRPFSTARSTSASNCASSRWPGPAEGGRLFNDAEFQPLRDELQRVAQEIGADTIEQVVYALGDAPAVVAAADYRLRQD